MLETIEKLEELAYHNVPVSVLKKYCNPLKCWMELEAPITVAEVKKALKNNEEELVETPLALTMIWGKNQVKLENARKNHIKKIAYFVKNEPIKPIGLDVGVPSLGCFVDYFIDDGNHRFAGSIIAKRKTIPCKISGSVEHIKELGLWYPNDAMLELDALYQKLAEEREESLKNKKSAKP